jgi:hypothetical protein
MGPGFFVFFQRNIIESGGYPVPPVGERGTIPEVWKYRPRVRFKFADEEEREVAEVVEQVFEAVEEEDTKDDLELILRLKLEAQQITFKALYMLWLEQEYARYLRWRQEQEAIFLLLLH